MWKRGFLRGLAEAEGGRGRAEVRLNSFRSKAREVMDDRR